MVDIHLNGHVHNQSVRSQSLAAHHVQSAHVASTALLHAKCAKELNSTVPANQDLQELEFFLDQRYNPSSDPKSPLSLIHIKAHEVRDLQEGMLAQLRNIENSSLKRQDKDDLEKMVRSRFEGDIQKIKQSPDLLAAFSQLTSDPKYAAQLKLMHQQSASTMLSQLVDRYQDLGTYEDTELAPLPNVSTEKKGVIFVDWDQTLTEGKDYQNRHGGDAAYLPQDKDLAKEGLNPRVIQFLISNLKNGVVTHIVTANTDTAGIEKKVRAILTKLAKKNPSYDPDKLLKDGGMIQVTHADAGVKGKVIKGLIDKYYPNISRDHMAFIDDQEGNLQDVAHATHMNVYQASQNAMLDSWKGGKRALDASGLTALTGLEALEHVLKGSHPSGSSDDFSVMTFNDRIAEADTWNKNHYPERAWDNSDLGEHDRHHRFCKEVLDHRPTFVGLQEVPDADHCKEHFDDKSQREELLKDLTETGPYKNVSFNNGDAGDNLLLYDPSKFTLAKDANGKPIQGSISLGKTSKYGTHVHVIWAKFINKKTGKPVMICSTHFPPERLWHFDSDKQKTLKEGLLSAQKACGAKTPMIMVGDFSKDPRGEERLSPFKDLGLRDTYSKTSDNTGPHNENGPVSRPEANGFGNWNHSEPNNWNPNLGHLDDGELCSDTIKVVSNNILTDRDPFFDKYNRGPAYASDHFAVQTEYQI